MVHHRATIAEVEAALNADGIRLQSSVGGTPYATDFHFRKFVFNGITVSELEAIADALDAESDRGSCTKAYMIREGLRDGGFYADHPEYLAARTRRTCCLCHETGSLAKAVTI